jgi:hypothetical protein
MTCPKARESLTTLDAAGVVECAAADDTGTPENGSAERIAVRWPARAGCLSRPSLQGQSRAARLIWTRRPKASMLAVRRQSSRAAAHGRIDDASWQKPGGAGVFVGDDQTRSQDLT